MKKIEIILIIFFVIAVILRFLHIPASGVLTVISLSALAELYFLLSFPLLNNIGFRKLFKKETYSDIEIKRIALSVVIGVFGFSTVIIGILFKVMFWKGGGIQLVAGLIFMTIVFVIISFFYIKEKTGFYKNTLIRFLIIAFIGMLMFLTPKTKIVDIIYGKNEYSEALKDVMLYPENNEYRQTLDSLRDLH